MPTPYTFYEGILSIPPGHVLVAEPGLSPQITPYWTLPTPPASTHSHVRVPEAARLVREQLRQAVERRLIADVPLGAFLSGGVDSSAVVAMMAELSDRPVCTFTIGFEDDRFDERSYARLVADRFRTDHTEFVVEPDRLG